MVAMWRSKDLRDSRLVMGGGSRQTVEDLERQWAKGLCFPITDIDPAAPKCQCGFVFTNNVKPLMVLHSMISVFQDSKLL